MKLENHRLSRKVATALLALLVFGGGIGFAQDVPEYVGDLAPLLARYGLTEEKINAFQTGAEGLDWSGAMEIDPLTLAFVFEYGLTMDGGPIDEPLVFAYAIAKQIARMAQMGLDDRQVALACTEATREAVQLMQQDRTQSMGEDGSELGEMLRTRLMNAAETQMLRVAARVRNSTPAGETHWVGGEQPGVPPEDPQNPDPGKPGGPN